MVSIPFDNITPPPAIDQLPVPPSNTPDTRTDSSFDDYLKPPREDDSSPAPDDTRANDTPPSDTKEDLHSDDNRQETADSTAPADRETDRPPTDEGDNEETEAIEVVLDGDLDLSPVVENAEITNVEPQATQLVETEQIREIAVVDGEAVEEAQPSAGKQVKVETPTTDAFENDESPRERSNSEAEITIEAVQAESGAEDEGAPSGPQASAAAAAVAATEQASSDSKRTSSVEGSSQDQEKQAKQERGELLTTAELEQVAAVSKAGESTESRERPAAQTTAATALESVNTVEGGESRETPIGPQARLEQHLLSRGQSRTNEPGQTSPADQARFVQRVARAFESARNQDGQLRLRLSPPELGSLRLEVKLQGGVMTARIEAETAAARTLLLESLPVLRDRLSEQGIRVEQFEVDVPDRQPGEMPDEAGDGGKRRSRSSAPESSQDDGIEDTSPESGESHRLEDDNLNVII